MSIIECPSSDLDLFKVIFCSVASAQTTSQLGDAGTAKCLRV